MHENRHYEHRSVVDRPANRHRKQRTYVQNTGTVLIGGGTKLGTTTLLQVGGTGYERGSKSESRCGCVPKASSAASVVSSPCRDLTSQSYQGRIDFSLALLM